MKKILSLTALALALFAGVSVSAQTNTTVTSVSKCGVNNGTSFATKCGAASASETFTQVQGEVGECNAKRSQSMLLSTFGWIPESFGGYRFISKPLKLGWTSRGTVQVTNWVAMPKTMVLTIKKGKVDGSWLIKVSEINHGEAVLRVIKDPRDPESRIFVEELIAGTRCFPNSW